MSWRASLSTPLPSEWLLPGLLSTSEQHRLLTDRLDLVLLAVLVLTAEWSEFAVLATSCLCTVSQHIPQSSVSGCTLQHIQTDSSKLVDVWVIDLGEEADLGWCHGIVFR